MLLGMNEFNPSMLEKAAREIGLPNLTKLFDLQRSRTHTRDTIESDYLEPWVQWVSVHTGEPSSVHGIKHLGDVPDLGRRQIWEVLSEMGISSGVWGAMNASRRGAEHCQFFVPDPWTFSEESYPPALNDLLAFPRYMAKNYLNVDKKVFVALALRFARMLLAPSTAAELAVELPRVLSALVKWKGANFVGYCFSEYLSTLIFLDWCRKHDPRFRMLFVNGIAHLQHYYWKDQEYALNPEFRYGLRYADKLVGKVLEAVEPGDVLVVMNGLSQVRQDRPFAAYRQYDHRAFLAAAGIPCERVEALMTHDAHLMFASSVERESARRILEGATVDGQPLFFVESNPHDETRLFYKIKYSGVAAGEAKLGINGRELRFADHFLFCAFQSGKHSPDGVVLCNQPLFPAELPNHEVFQHLVGYFKEELAGRRAA